MLLVYHAEVESIRCISDIQQPCISKTIGHKAKWTTICASGVSRVYSVLLTVNVYGHSEIMRCISDFQQRFISKAIGRRAKRTKMCAYGKVVSIYRVILTVKCLRPGRGYSVHVRLLTGLHSYLNYIAT